MPDMEARATERTDSSMRSAASPNFLPISCSTKATSSICQCEAQVILQGQPDCGRYSEQRGVPNTKPLLQKATIDRDCQANQKKQD